MTLSNSFQTDKVPSTFPSKFSSLVEQEERLKSTSNENKKQEMLREKVRVEKEARARERIHDKAKKFEINLKFGENQDIEASGYAKNPKYTMVTLGHPCARG